MMSQQRALVRMPEVVGLPLRKAKFLIENAGLAVDAIVFQESYEERDTVLTQKPARGQMIYTGEKVTLGVSRESYVKWLPSIFQRNDLNGRNFLRDLLWIVQHLFTSVDEQLDVIHNFFDPYEAPEKFLPWLASWSAMVLEEDWPIAKKRRLIKKAIEMYRIRGTVKGIKLFISLFTGHEPDINENIWPFRGWRIGVTADIGIDSVVLPPVNLAHTFVVEMPVSYKDISPEAVIRIHEIIQMEKPANTQYYLRFAVEGGPSQLREFYTVGVSSGVGVGMGVAESEAITSEADLQKLLDQQGREQAQAAKAKVATEEIDDFMPGPKTRPPLPKAPKADTAPVEGKEGPRSSEAGGFGASAREMSAISITDALEVMPTSEMPAMSTKTGVAPVDPKKTGATKAVKKVDEKTEDKDKKSDDTKGPKK
ncbi:MAG TPA: phage tail protein I [Polyangia bacterium]|nr:phage tail protein I [Polyangia bacterium]